MKTKLLKEVRKNLIEIVIYKDEVERKHYGPGCVIENDKYYSIDYSIKYVNREGFVETVSSYLFSECLRKAIKGIIDEKRYEKLLMDHEKTVASRNRWIFNKIGYKINTIYTLIK